MSRSRCSAKMTIPEVMGNERPRLNSKSTTALEWSMVSLAAAVGL